MNMPVFLGRNVGLFLCLVSSGLTNWQISALRRVGLTAEPTPEELVSLIKFECHELPAGYYADHGLECKVFHYCNGFGDKFTYKCDKGRKFDERTSACALYPIPGCEYRIFRETRPPKQAYFEPFRGGIGYSTSEFLNSFNNDNKQNDILSHNRNRNSNLKAHDQKDDNYYLKNLKTSSHEDLGALSAFASVIPDENQDIARNRNVSGKDRFQRFTNINHPYPAVEHTPYGKPNSLLAIIDPIHRIQRPAQHFVPTPSPHYNNNPKNILTPINNPIRTYSSEPTENYWIKNNQYYPQNYEDKIMNQKNKYNRHGTGNHRFESTSGLPLTSHFTFKPPGATETFNTRYESNNYYNIDENHGKPDKYFQNSNHRYQSDLLYGSENNRSRTSDYEHWYSTTTMSSVEDKRTEDVSVNDHWNKYVFDKINTSQNPEDKNILSLERPRNKVQKEHNDRDYAHKNRAKQDSMSTPTYAIIQNERPITRTEKPIPRYNSINRPIIQAIDNIYSIDDEYEYDYVNQDVGHSLQNSNLSKYGKDQYNEELHSSDISPTKMSDDSTTQRTNFVTEHSTNPTTISSSTIPASSEKTPLERFRELAAFHRAKLDSNSDRNINVHSISRVKNNLEIDVKKVAPTSNVKRTIAVRNKGSIKSNIYKQTKRRRRPVKRRRRTTEAPAPTTSYKSQEFSENLVFSEIPTSTAEPLEVSTKLRILSYPPPVERKRQTLADVRERFKKLKMRRKSTRLPAVGQNSIAKQAKLPDSLERKTDTDNFTEELSNNVTITKENRPNIIPKRRHSYTERQDTNILKPIKYQVPLRTAQNKEHIRYDIDTVHIPESDKILAVRKVNGRKKRRRLSNPNARARFREFLKTKVSMVEEYSVNHDSKNKDDDQRSFSQKTPDIQALMSANPGNPSSIDEKLDTRKKRLTNDANYNENVIGKKNIRINQVIGKPYRYLLNRQNNTEKQISQMPSNNQTAVNQNKKYSKFRNRSVLAPITSHKVIQPTNFKQVVEMSPRPIDNEESSNPFSLDLIHPEKNPDKKYFSESNVTPASTGFTSILPEFHEAKRRKYVRRKNKFKKSNYTFSQDTLKTESKKDSLPKIQKDDIFNFSKMLESENKQSSFHSKPFFNLDSIKGRKSQSKVVPDVIDPKKVQSMLDSHPFIFATEQPRLPLEYILPLT